MLMNLLIGVPTMSLCLFLQVVLLVQAMRYHARHNPPDASTSLWSALVVLNSIMTILVLGIFGQLSIWALVFLILGEFGDFHEAIYHSAVNFATLGYGDFVMSEGNKFLGPLEAINGALMIGISTAALLGAFQDAVRRATATKKNADSSTRNKA
jgi:hypothetical protein